MKKLTLTNAEVMKNVIRKEINSIEDGSFIHRLDALLLIAHGRNAYEVAKMYGHSPRTLHDWIKGVNSYGLQYLRDEARSGRPSRLSKENLKELKDTVARTPESLGYPYGRWDGKLLSEHIRKKYGVSLKVRRCQSLFHEMGFSYKRPRKMAYGSTPEAKKAFKKNGRINR